ncbi:MAG: hypothetical protein J2P38_10830 [Candidatus Dormibacteraeota bacterium]|nr:hypothetical protein [Candidatus Dormibacteraeota bacterium]
MTVETIGHCPPDCDLRGTDHHDVEVTATGATLIHHVRAFGPVTLYLDETLGQPSYAVGVHVDDEDADAAGDPAAWLMHLASGALRAATYVAQLYVIIPEAGEGTDSQQR